MKYNIILFMGLAFSFGCQTGQETFEGSGLTLESPSKDYLLTKEYHFGDTLDLTFSYDGSEKLLYLSYKCTMKEKYQKLWGKSWFGFFGEDYYINTDSVWSYHWPIKQEWDELPDDLWGATNGTKVIQMRVVAENHTLIYEYDLR